MSALKIFEKEEFGSVRVVMKDGEPWFVARDVAQALGYSESSLETIGKLFGHVPAEWLDRKQISVRSESGVEQLREVLIISEQGLYFFLGRSDKSAALPYQKWIAGDVVPTIRKTGGYGQWNLPRAPKSFPDALRMIAAIEEEKQLALEQRDYYKRTKAEIGSRREATSMATASAAVRKAHALEDRLGEGQKYRSVKRIEWLLAVFVPSRGMYSQVGSKLSKLGERMGKPPRTIEDSNYGTVKAHHVDVIEAFRLNLEQDRNPLGRYRTRREA